MLCGHRWRPGSKSSWCVAAPARRFGAAAAPLRAACPRRRYHPTWRGPYPTAPPPPCLPAPACLPDDACTKRSPATLCLLTAPAFGTCCACLSFTLQRAVPHYATGALPCFGWAGVAAPTHRVCRFGTLRAAQHTTSERCAFRALPRAAAALRTPETAGARMPISLRAAWLGSLAGGRLRGHGGGMPAIRFAAWRILRGWAARSFTVARAGRYAGHGRRVDEPH